MQLRRISRWVLLAFAGLATDCGTHGNSLENSAWAHNTGHVHPEASPVATAQDYPGVRLDDLSGEQRQQFAKIVEDEMAPCGTPHTLAGCLKTAKCCPLGVQMANFVDRELVLGSQSSEILVSLAEDFRATYSGKPSDIDLKDAPVRGAKNGRITIVEFADFQCPACAAFEEYIAELFKRYPTQVRVVFKHFPLSGHPFGGQAARAAEAAKRQGKFWEMHDYLFKNQLDLNDASLPKFARAIGLDAGKFAKDYADPALEQAVNRQREDGVRAGVDGTPTFFINGRKYTIRKTLEHLMDRIDYELALKADKAP